MNVRKTGYAVSGDRTSGVIYPPECKTKKQFYVECKYRSDEYRKDEKLEWTYPEQLKRYKEVSKDIPVFIALGIQGTSYDPDFIFLIPLKNVSFCGFYDSFLSKYELCKRKPVFPSYLWGLENKNEIKK